MMLCRFSPYFSPLSQLLSVEIYLNKNTPHFPISKLLGSITISFQIPVTEATKGMGEGQVGEIILGC